MEKLNQILSEVFRLKAEDIHDNLKMKDIEKWDSLTHMDLVTSIEDELQIELSMDDIMSMKDIKTIRLVVQKKLSS